MEKIFSSIMAGFMKGLSEEDKKKMMSCGQKMAAMCPCTTMKDMSEEEKKAFMEKMMTFCSSNKEKMSGLFKKMCCHPDQSGGTQKA